MVFNPTERKQRKWNDVVNGNRNMRTPKPKNENVETENRTHHRNHYG